MTSAADLSRGEGTSANLRLPGMLLGVGLGGFVDGAPSATGSTPLWIRAGDAGL